MTLQLISVGLMLSNFYFFFLDQLSRADIKIRNSLYLVFRNYLLKEIRPKSSPLGLNY